MKKEEIHLGDLNRWLFGQTPPEFMIEVAIRTVLIYLILLLIVRLMGKRMTAQVTITELSVMVTFGAIVSPVMQLPDRGLVFGVIGLGVALVFQRGINLWAFKNEKVEHLTQGKMSTIIKDGTLQLEELEKMHLTRQEVYAMLREKQVLNLGNVKRAYMEACGILTVFENEQSSPGLPVFPEADQKIKIIQKEAVDNSMACANCGHVQKITSQDTSCEICHSREWSKAYVATK